MTSAIFYALPRIFVLLAAVACTLYYLRLRPLLALAGVWRDFEITGNENCKTVPELQACEKIVLHRETGILYLACSDPQTRSRWMPAMSFYNHPDKSTDYIATYNPADSEVERLVLADFMHDFGISVHGMDVVSSAKDTFIYLVNHRPYGTGNAAELGADSVIEVFKTKPGRAGKLFHVTTVSHPLIVSPNDVVGTPDGKSFYFTNDNPVKIGHFRKLASILMHAKDNNIIYCSTETGACKTAITKLSGANGITKSPWNETYYAANHRLGGVKVLERQLDDTLLAVDDIPTDRILDNISVDGEGHLWAAGIPNLLQTLAHFTHPHSKIAPSSVFRVSANPVRGEKYRVHKVFEDDGSIASGSTSAVYDPKTMNLFVHGLVAPHLTVCSMKLKE